MSETATIFALHFLCRIIYKSHKAIKWSIVDLVFLFLLVHFINKNCDHIQSQESRIQNSEFRVQNSESRIKNSYCIRINFYILSQVSFLMMTFFEINYFRYFIIASTTSKVVFILKSFVNNNYNSSKLSKDKAFW